MMNATQIRKGMIIALEGEYLEVLEIEHRTPGNLRAKIQATMRSLRSGAKIQKRFRADETIEVPFIEKRVCEYLYAEADSLILMDLQTYDQFPIAKALAEDAEKYLIPNMQVTVLYVDGKPVNLELPTSVVLTVTEADPGIKGDSRSNITKNAIVETGLVVKVPLFIKEGERIRIDTRTGEFLERVAE